ncbi:hypothetical protein K443DRAFT_612357 [Laccaria amethystina LaAM-08-1]|uniref:Uncharacterized protein n=1 Tax=Laccaria amethystina LaAM-08-1 TaxID=1095629 RepID=A0A0C9WQ68_9AGAR|nr:hypothetical protein K443DRAFT_612357 [Laccaria amethystina LaAM-08-1]
MLLSARPKAWVREGVYLCTQYGYFGFSVTGMALANRILDRTQCQFGCNRPTSYKPSSVTGEREVSFAPYVWTASELPVIGSLYWYNRCHSGVQESLRATFFVQI